MHAASRERLIGLFDITTLKHLTLGSQERQVLYKMHFFLQIYFFKVVFIVIYRT